MKIPSHIVVVIIAGFLFLITGIVMVLLKGEEYYLISIGLAAILGSFYYTIFSFDNKEKSEIDESNKKDLT